MQPVCFGLLAHLACGLCGVIVIALMSSLFAKSWEIVEVKAAQLSEMALTFHELQTLREYCDGTIQL